MSLPPIMRCMYDGEMFKPVAGFNELAKEHYFPGRTVLLTEYQDRSVRSHDHYFAVLAEGHANLPDHLAVRFPTVEHLRKHLLIRAGYRDEVTMALPSKALAARVAAFVRPMDEYAIVTVRGAVVTRWTAQSQSYRAMGKDDFQRSKEAVLDALAELIGVDRHTLETNAGMAA